MTTRKLVLTLLLAIVSVCFTGCGGTTSAAGMQQMSGHGSMINTGK